MNTMVAHSESLVKVIRMPSTHPSPLSSLCTVYIRRKRSHIVMYWCCLSAVIWVQNTSMCSLTGGQRTHSLPPTEKAKDRPDTYLPTYLPTYVSNSTDQSPSCKTCSRSAYQEMFAIHGTRRFTAVFIRTRHRPLFCAR